MILRCQRCRRTKPLEGERYCVHCRRLVIEELERVGYLEPIVDEVGYDDHDKESNMWYQKRRERQE